MAPGSVLFTAYRELQDIYTSLTRIEELVEIIGQEVVSLETNILNEPEIGNQNYLQGLVDGYSHIYNRLNQILYGAVPGAPNSSQVQGQSYENT